MARPLDPIIAIADEALDAWGKETGDRKSTAPLDWPADTLLARVIEYGTDGAAQGGGARVTLSDRSMAVDAAVLMLPRKHQKVLHRWYRSRDRYNQTVCARSVSMSHRIFAEYLKHGREMIATLLGIRQ